MALKKVKLPERLSQLFEYGYFWKEFGMDEKKVDSLDPKLLAELRLKNRVENEKLEGK